MFPNKQLPNKQLLLYLKSSAEIIFPRKFMQSFKTKNILAGWDAELCQLCCLLARSWCNSGWWCHTLDLFQLLEQLTPAAVCWIQRPVFWVINEVAASIFLFLFFLFCFVMSLSAYIRTISSSVYSYANRCSCSGFWGISSLSDILLWKHHYSRLLHAESPTLFLQKQRTSDFGFLAIWHIS